MALRQKMRAAAMLLALAVAGCGGMTLDTFARHEPRIEIEKYFAGQVRAYGLFEPRFGAGARQFTVDIDGTWDGRELVLDERFLFRDGETDRRLWRIVRTADGGYEGRADDVVGVARGRSAGNALSWQYDLMLKVGDGRWQVHFDDWMILHDDDVMLNRATVSKWGIRIGEVTIAFRRLS